MDAQEHIDLYVVLRSLDRFVKLLAAEGVNVSPLFLSVLDQAWVRLGGGRKVNLKGFEKEMRGAVVDEQDATTEQIYYNMFLYSISDLAQYFKEGLPESLGCVESAILDFYDFFASQKYFLNNGIVDAVVLNADQEREIRNDSTYSAEMRMLAADRLSVAQRRDWSDIESDR